MEQTKPRGQVVLGKRQVNWRIDERWLQNLEVEKDRLGFSTIPALVNFIFAARYTGEKEDSIENRD